MKYSTCKTLLVSALLGLAGGNAAAQQCQQWQRVNTPSPGTVSNFFIDAEEANGTVYALMFSTDSTQVRPPGEYRVLRRDGDTWTDLSGPDDEVLSNTEFNALGVAPDGETIYVGGLYFPTAVGQDPAPVMAVGDAGGNWGVPVEIEIPPTAVEPVSRRAAQILSIEVAANGTAFATGGAQGFGGGALGIDGTVPLFLVNDGSGWVETGVEPGQDWPGGSGIGGPGTRLNDMHLFATDDVWLAGRHDDNGTTGGGLLLHWDGTELTVEEDPRQGGVFLLRDFFGIDGNAPTALHAVGGNDIEQQPVGTMALRDIDGWSLLSTPWLTSVVEDLATASDVVVAADGTAWASTLFGASETPYYDGTQWSLRPFVPAGDAANGASVRRMAEATGTGTLWGFGFLNPDLGARESYAIQCSGVIFADGFEPSQP